MPARLRLSLVAAAALIMLAACAPNGSYIILITATPDAAARGSTSGGSGSGAIIPPSPALTTQPQAAPTPTFIPTPNPTRAAVPKPLEDQMHIVQFGDTLSIIAERYGVTVEAIMAANQLVDANLLSVGQSLIIPLATQGIGTDFKILPDSELVYGPAAKNFDVVRAMQTLPESFLANYQEEFNGQLWSGPEIVERVALEQSINPRLLLALLEYETHWLSQSSVSEQAALYPLNYTGQASQVYGLYRQLDWAGKMLQLGYYGWKQRGLTAALLADGARVALNPTINAGTAGVQMLLAQTRTYDTWLYATSHNGFFATFSSLFGDPFSRAVEPLIPPDLQQPPMGFPWDSTETWYFTGGPHGGWGSQSAWAALDFVTGDEPSLGCEVSDKFARAVADGAIARSEYGIVVLDLDGDGYEGTGWTVFYLHISSEDRPVREGQRVRQGDPIGHPSCEGGVSFATHLHIARRYNGEWIPADCSACLVDAPLPPLNLNGWVASTWGVEYDGWLVKGDDYREACVCREPINTFLPEQQVGGQ